MACLPLDRGNKAFARHFGVRQQPGTGLEIQSFRTITQRINSELLLRLFGRLSLRLGGSVEVRIGFMKVHLGPAAKSWRIITYKKLSLEYRRSPNDKSPCPYQPAI